MATTADQIVVELRAVVDQHDAAMNKSADVTEAAMKDIERAVDKATGTVVNDAARTVEAVEPRVRRGRRPQGEGDRRPQGDLGQGGPVGGRAPRVAARRRDPRHQRRDHPVVYPAVPRRASRGVQRQRRAAARVPAGPAPDSGGTFLNGGRGGRNLGGAGGFQEHLLPAPGFHRPGKRRHRCPSAFRGSRAADPQRFRHVGLCSWASRRPASASWRPHSAASRAPRTGPRSRKSPSTTP